MTIKIITLFVCDWCEDAYQADGAGPVAIRDAQLQGWRNDSGNDFCCETCFDCHFDHAQELASDPSRIGAADGRE